MKKFRNTTRPIRTAMIKWITEALHSQRSWPEDATEEDITKAMDELKKSAQAMEEKVKAGEDFETLCGKCIRGTEGELRRRG